MAAIWIPKRLVEINLVNVAAESPESLIKRCEGDYAARVNAAADAVLDSGCKVVMLTGPSASGKTTSAHRLADALTGRGCQAQVVSLDNFYKDLDQYPRLPDGSKDYENVTALDMPEIQKCLLEIVQTGETELPVFDFLTELRKEERQHFALKNGVCVVEGIHALNPELISTLPSGTAYRIYAGLREEYSSKGARVLPTRDIRLARRMVRDNKFRGHSLSKTMNMWGSVCAGEDQFIKVFKNKAELLLDTSFSYEICMLGPLVASLAGALPEDDPACEKLNHLAGCFAQCRPIGLEMLPENSMLQEFLGRGEG